jgi:uncharacterized peroxidase-related enzyme
MEETMDQRTRPAPRLAPLPPDHTPALKDQFETARKRMGFIPNSVLIMQRVPQMVDAFTKMSAAIWNPQGSVDLKLKRLISHVASRSAGCRYCMAHTADGAAKLGVEQRKLDAVWDYKTSPLFDDAERAALDVAVAAGCVPNAVTDEMFAAMREHYDDEQCVEIVAVIALFGFLNRWNETIATALEEEPLEFAGEHLVGPGSWTPGRHAARSEAR